MVSYLIAEVLRNNKLDHSKVNIVHSKLMFKLVLNVYDHVLICLYTSRNPFITYAFSCFPHASYLVKLCVP